MTGHLRTKLCLINFVLNIIIARLTVVLLSVYEFNGFILLPTDVS